MTKDKRPKDLAKLWQKHRVFQTKLKRAGPLDIKPIRVEAAANWKEITDTLDRLAEEIPEEDAEEA